MGDENETIKSDVKEDVPTLKEVVKTKTENPVKEKVDVPEGFVQVVNPTKKNVYATNGKIKPGCQAIISKQDCADLTKLGRVVEL